MSQERRSAKAIIEQYVNELLTRSNEHQLDAKLGVIEVIALRMGWNDLYNRLRFREVKKPWWVEK